MSNNVSLTNTRDIIANSYKIIINGQAVDLLTYLQSGISLTPSKVVISDGTGALSAAPVDSSELNNLVGVSNPIQGQLNDRYNKIEVDALLDTLISTIIDGAPAQLNTLKEIADSLNSDSNLYATLSNLINTKENTITIDSTTGQSLAYINGSTTHIKEIETLSPLNVITNLNKIELSLNSTVTNTELDYLSGVSSNVQTQLDSKQSTLLFDQPLINTTGTISLNPIINLTSIDMNDYQLVSDINNLYVKHLDNTIFTLNSSTLHVNSVYIYMKRVNVKKKYCR